MTYFIVKTPDLATNGPLIAVKLWVPLNVKSDALPIDALAEINIALAHTYIQEGIATSLGLEPAGTMIVTSSTKPKYEAHIFRLRVAFPDEQMVFEVSAVEVPYMLRPKKRIKCLIGRDILQYSVLSYDGPNNTFSLKF
jgi:hypothetical protein